MAWIVVRAFAVSTALALAGSIVRAQDNSPVTSTTQAVSRRNARIVSLVERLADQARRSDDMSFAVRAQSQAAAMLWPLDPDEARSIYRRAFKSLAPEPSSKPPDSKAIATVSASADSPRVLTPIEKQRLRGELVNQIASRDPELAEELARGPGDSTDKVNCAGDSAVDCGFAGGASTRGFPMYSSTVTVGNLERCEILMSAAIQIVDRDPQQAMAFAQMSVALGFSSNLARLLTLMRGVDPERADLLFSNAVVRLEQAPRVRMTDVHALGSYIVSVVNSASGQPPNKQIVMRFLDLAFDQIARSGEAMAAHDDSSASYFVGRQLNDLLSRYEPDRLDELQDYTGAQVEAGYDQDISSGEMIVRSPSEVARDAREASEGAERDALYARASLGWLSQGDFKEAQNNALKIADNHTRDRVLIQIVRRQSSAKRGDDAVALARRIVDEPSRIDAITLLGAAAGASDTSRASELLNDAEASAVKTRPSIERARSLVKIAGSFAAFDKVRSFEVLQSAVKALNEQISRLEDSKDPQSEARAAANRSLALDELMAASFEATLAALAREDFERALSLAQQLTGEEASVIAQLAVCRGGLIQRSADEASESDEDLDGGVRH